MATIVRLVSVLDFDLQYGGGYSMRYHAFCGTLFAVFAICGICGIISVAVFAVYHKCGFAVFAVYRKCGIAVFAVFEQKLRN